MTQRPSPAPPRSHCTRLLLASFVAAQFALTLTPCPAEQSGPPRRVLAADDSAGRIAIVAPDGSLEWEMKVGAIHDAALLPNGHILLQQGWTRVIEVTTNRQVIWEYDAAKRNGNEGRRVEVHAFQRLPDGLTLIAESGPARIIEVDTDGRLRHEIKLVVHHPNPHSDTRLVRKISNGHYLVAHESDGAVREYDATGRVVWEYEVPLFGQARKGGHGPEAFGNSVFSAIRLGNGNTLIGAGNGHAVLEVTPEKQIVWQIRQNDLPGITLAWVTRVERLANGHTLFGNCHAGPGHPQFIEVTPDKKVVWTFQDWKNFGNSMPVQIALEARP
jgi:hypothetical protein